MTMPKRESRFPIWLVWSLNHRSLLALNAVDTSQAVANDHRRMLLQEHDGQIYIRVWVELSEANHLFGASLLDYPAVGNERQVTAEKLNKLEAAGKIPSSEAPPELS
ncbi:hypothetical protein LCGC14_1164870 [marine sediment metagenome]|uniref:Uncharacterized protein n=1 Tax=marine sediment metagenome TaxID=412755 RepID=A0A0F9LRM2_9ZZZZ